MTINIPRALATAASVSGDLFNPCKVAYLVHLQEPAAETATYFLTSGLYAYVTITTKAGERREIRINS